MLWDLEAHGVRTVFEGHPPSEQRSVYWLDASPDGRWLASAGKDGIVKIWPIAAPTP